MPFKGVRVLHIIPAAPDWRAVFADESEEGLIIETQLAGWALVERDDQAQAVVGFDAVGEAESCEALENFLGYAAPGEMASRWHREAVRFFHERGAVKEPPRGEAPGDVIHRLFDAIERQEWATVGRSYHPDVDYSDPDTHLRGRERVVERARSLEEPFVEASFAITSEVAADDRAAVTWIYRGRNDRRLTLPSGTEMPATGRQVELPGSSFFRLAGGLIVSESSQWDNAALYHQLGLLSDPALFGSW